MTDPTSIEDMRTAAKSFGSPSATACQVTVARQVNAAQSIRVVTPAAKYGAFPPPLSIQNPQAALSEPKALPDFSAVFAAAGLDAYPNKPQTNKNSPKPMYQRPKPL